MKRRDARYRRHGALALYAALKVHEGEILGRMEKRFTHAEFISFIKTVYGRWGGVKELHFIVDISLCIDTKMWWTCWKGIKQFISTLRLRMLHG